MVPHDSKSDLPLTIAIGLNTSLLISLYIHLLPIQGIIDFGVKIAKNFTEVGKCQNYVSNMYICTYSGQHII